MSKPKYQVGDIVQWQSSGAKYEIIRVHDYEPYYDLRLITGPRAGRITRAWYEATLVADDFSNMVRRIQRKHK